LTAAILTERLDGANCAKLSGFGAEDGCEKGAQAAVGTVTELGEQKSL
jgi:hypothetical protein